MVGMVSFKRPFSFESLGLTGKKCFLWIVLYAFGYLKFDLRWVVFTAGAYYLFKIWRQSRKPSQQPELDDNGRKSEAPMDKSKDCSLPSWVIHPDMHRVEFVNRVIQQLWPHVEMHLVQVLKALEEDTQMKERLSGYHIKYLKFPVVHLGKIPPRITGVKVHKSVHRDEIIVDVGVQYSGDLCIQMECALDSLPSYVPPASASIRNLSLTSSSLRVHLRPLLADIPFVGAVTISFLQPPEIDFDLGGIANAFDVPGVSLLLRHVIQDQMEQTIVMPNSMTIELVPENERKKRPTNFGHSKEPNSAPVVVSLPAGVLNVHIIEAKGLVNKDSVVFGQGKSDPYATVEIRADAETHNFKTEVIQNNLHPVWKMLIDLPVDNPETLEDLSICVFDEDKYGKDESLGKCTIPVQVLRTAITSGQTQDVWKLLEGVKRGSLHVQIGWSELKLSNSGGDSSSCHHAALVVIVDSCSSLLGGRTGLKLPNPRIKVEVCGVIQFTETVVGSVEPVFSHRMSFLVNDPLSDSLLVTVEDDRREKQVLGTLRLDLSDVLERTSLSMVNHRFALTSRVLRGKRSPEIVLTVALRYIHRPKTFGYGVHKSLQELHQIMTTTTTISQTPTANSNPNEAAKNVSIVEEVDSSKSEQKPLLFFIDDDAEKITEKLNNHENGLTKNPEEENPFSAKQILTNRFVDEVPKMKLTNGELSKSIESKSEPRFDSMHQIDSNHPSKTATLPSALSDYQLKSEEAREFVRANSVSGTRARDRIVVEDRRPKIQLSLKYNNRTKTLSVVVHKIKNLHETQHTSLPSAYVKTRILERAERPGSNRRLPHTKRKTKTQRHTASPVFEETLEYCLHESDLRYRRLEVSVWHDSRLSVLGLNTVLGRCLVSLDAVASAIDDEKVNPVEGTTLTDWHVLSHEGEDHFVRSAADPVRSTLPRKGSKMKSSFGSKASLHDIEKKNH